MNKPYLLALNRLRGIGPRTVLSLLQRWPRLEVLFQLPKQDLQAMGLPPKLAHAISNCTLAAVEQDIKWENAAPNRYILTLEDKQYPALLKEIYDPPLVLYAQGNLEAFNNPALAIVGTRKPSPHGGDAAWRFAYELSPYLTIVSGLALGIDAKAHQGCIDHEGSTIAIMGTGMLHIYPAIHKQLASNILRKGLILSEFSLNQAPTPGHFPRRNRIISGLSLATLVVEAAIKSGSLITARLALEQNRDVLAIPGSINNPQARGCHYLVQQGAKLVTSPQDVLDELEVISPKIDELLPARPFTFRDKGEKLLAFVGFEITTIHDIMVRSNLSFEVAASGLAELELQGIIKAVTGGYIRCAM